MRTLALCLLLASATAYADGQTVKIVVEAKTNAKAEAAMKTEAEKHRDKLEAAAAGKAYEVHISATLDRKGDATKCTLKAQIFAGKTIVGVLSGGASVTGPEDGAATDCVEAVVGNLIDTKVVQAIAAKKK